MSTKFKQYAVISNSIIFAQENPKNIFNLVYNLEILLMLVAKCC